VISVAVVERQCHRSAGKGLTGAKRVDGRTEGYDGTKSADGTKLHGDGRALGTGPSNLAANPFEAAPSQDQEPVRHNVHRRRR
jgi:hypothetical protein